VRTVGDDSTQNGGVIDADTITADLHSGDPARVTRSLAVLDQDRPIRQHAQVPLPSANCLTAFGDDLTEETLDLFVRVVHNYVPFEPSPEPSGRHTTVVDAVLLYGPGQPVFDVAMFIRVDSSADYVTKDVMRHLSRYPRETESELAVVEQLIDYLLDGRATHDAAVNGLASWAFYGEYPQVVDNLLPQLDPAERKRVLDERREGSA
jgi:hypothetical protein